MKNKLTGANQHRLNMWLEKHRDIAIFASHAELAEKAQSDLGTAVSECNIRSARKIVGAERRYMQIKACLARYQELKRQEAGK
jgi:hypothetical protein